jgi:hypothetical protein
MLDGEVMAPNKIYHEAEECLTHPVLSETMVTSPAMKGSDHMMRPMCWVATRYHRRFIAFQYPTLNNRSLTRHQKSMDGRLWVM